MRALITALTAISLTSPALAAGCWEPVSGDTEMEVVVGQEEFAFRNWECSIASVDEDLHFYAGACFNDDGGVTRLAVDENGDTALVAFDNGPLTQYRRCD